jgi:aryl-alcohol dehydrogenase-like predicted oxidoreductase
LFGAKTIEQVEDNVKAVEVYKKITPEVNERIEAIMQSRPNPGFNWKTWQPLPHRV